MFGGTRARPALSLVAIALLGAAGAGCGSDDDSGSSTTSSSESAANEEVRYSEANESPQVFAERFARLLATTTAKKDCAQLEGINDHSLSRSPCPAPKDLRKSMAGFEVVGVQEYGTGAVVDYKSGAAKDGAAIVTFVAPDRNWGISRFGVITPPSTKTSDAKNRAGYDKTVDDYLAAVRDSDCEAFIKVAFTGDAKTKKSVCGGAFALTSGLAKRLKANPSAKPAYQGGNGTFGFYTLETSRPKPENATISVVKEGAGPKASYLVLDVAPSPTAADQLRIRQAAQESAAKQGDTTPSSKPSDPAVKP